MKFLEMDALGKPLGVVQHEKHPVYQYVAMALLLVLAAGYQALLARDVFRGIVHPESVYQLPFIVSPTTAILSVYTDGVSEAMDLREEVG